MFKRICFTDPRRPHRLVRVQQRTCRARRIDDHAGHVHQHRAGYLV